MTIFCIDRRSKIPPYSGEADSNKAVGAGFKPALTFNDLYSDQSGLSMTEGIIVIPFFLIIWVGFIALHGIYMAAIETQVSAQNLALSGAAVGQCEGGSEGDADNAEMDEALENVDSADVGGASVSAGTLIEQSGGASLFDWSHHRVGASAEAEGVTVDGSAILMCNAEPRDGLADMIYGFLEDLF